MWANRFAIGLQKGQGLLEYALIMMLVALIVLVILAVLGPSVGNMFSNLIPLI
jgi:pilus assembly protein Flp/PilA